MCISEVVEWRMLLFVRAKSMRGKNVPVNDRGGLAGTLKGGECPGIAMMADTC